MGQNYWGKPKSSKLIVKLRTLYLVLNWLEGFSALESNRANVNSLVKQAQEVLKGLLMFWKLVKGIFLLQK